MWWGGLAYQRLDDAGKVLGHPNVTAPLLETMGQRGALFMDIWEAIDFGGNNTGWVQSFIGIVI